MFFLADAWTGTAEMTGLVILALVLKWLGDQAVKLINVWIEREKVQVERVAVGTQFITEFAPRMETKLDGVVEDLKAALELLKAMK